MRCDDLQMLYRHLRRELDAAYAARPWDAARIDRIAEDLLHLEHTLRARHEQPPLKGGFGWVRPMAVRS
jgi:hypothetical protein